MFCPFAKTQERQCGGMFVCIFGRYTTKRASLPKGQVACLVLRSGCGRQQRCASNGTECHASKSARRLLRLDHQVFRLSSEELPCREHAQGNLKKKKNITLDVGLDGRSDVGHLDIGHWTWDLGRWTRSTRWTRWTHWARWTR